jgi:hypothetical protein
LGTIKQKFKSPSRNPSHSSAVTRDLNAITLKGYINIEVHWIETDCVGFQQSGNDIPVFT